METDIVFQNFALPDFVSLLLSGDQIRWLLILFNAGAAAIIAPLAFAVSRDAGWRCKQARIRLLHRWLLIGFAAILAYNADLLWTMGRPPIGSALLVNIGIVILTSFSAYRLSHAPDLPAEAGRPGMDVKFIATLVRKR